MTIPRSVIEQAFPNQPRMQSAFEALVNQAETLVDNLSTVADTLAKNKGNTDAALAQLGEKQPLNSILTELAALPTDPGVPEQVQPGSWQIRPIDAADTRSLLSRQEADTRYLGGNHTSVSTDKLSTARSIAMSGDVVWTVTFDGSANVTASGTIQAHVVSFSKLVAATQKALIGANAAGNFQEITLGSGLSLTAGVLSATGGGGSSFSVVTKTAGYTETTTSGEIVILASFASGGTILLPTAVGNTAKFTVKKLLSASTVVIDGNASETIDGGLTATLTNQYEAISFVSDGSNWWII